MSEYKHENWMIVFADDAGFVINSYTGYYEHWRGKVPHNICQKLPEELVKMLKEDDRC